MTRPINIQVVTRGQSTRSQATHAIKVEMTTKTAPRGDTKGGRHPHPPTGNNKKLKHTVRKLRLISLLVVHVKNVHSMQGNIPIIF